MRFAFVPPHISHEHKDFDQVVFALGCAGSLLAKRLNRTHVVAPETTILSLAYIDHRRSRIPEYGGEVIITELSANCTPSPNPFRFFHINVVDSESRGTLSLDGFNTTPTQSILEVIVRKHLCQAV